MNSIALKKDNSGTQGQRRRTTMRVAMVFLVSSLVVAACATRIWWVNTLQYPYPYPVEHHAMGEWVDLDGAFIDAATEDTAGYAVRVTGAELMSYREYVERYGTDENIEAMGNLDELPSSVQDSQSILCLTMELENHRDDADGAIFLGEATLIPEGLPVTYSYDGILWGIANPNIGVTSLYIGVLPHTSTTQYIPYGLSRHNNDSYGRYRDDLPVSDSWQLVISNAPVSHVIDIELTS